MLLPKKITISSLLTSNHPHNFRITQQLTLNCIRTQKLKSWLTNNQVNTNHPHLNKKKGNTVDTMVLQSASTCRLPSKVLWLSVNVDSQYWIVQATVTNTTLPGNIYTISKRQYPFTRTWIVLYHSPHNNTLYDQIQIALFSLPIQICLFKRKVTI